MGTQLTLKLPQGWVGEVHKIKKACAPNDDLSFLNKLEDLLRDLWNF